LPSIVTSSGWSCSRAGHSRRGFEWAQRLALFTRDRAGSGQHFAFRIPADMAEQVRNAIVSAGFPEETMEQDDGLSVYVRDPDGNKIELYGRRAKV
jgi:catechol 2,3-dioxygenase-like lactoylglutathione lyase family enzyme